MIPVRFALLIASPEPITDVEHKLSQQDVDFRAAFEAGVVSPSDFSHEAHVRLAYVYVVENGVDGAAEKMRKALLNFLKHNNIPQSKFHETITRAWVLAVRHFMSRSVSESAGDFIAQNRELLDTKIMLTHYSAAVLFSTEARAHFVDPDIDPIPLHGDPPFAGTAA